MKNFDDKIIVCYKDFSIEMVSETKIPNHKLISFILVPIVGSNSKGYLYVKNKNLFKFSSASISFKFLVEYYGDGTKGKVVVLDGRTVVTGSLIEFCNLIYSLSKYSLVTSFENCYMRDDIPYEISVEPEYLDLWIYNDEDDVIFSTSITREMRTPEKFGILDGIINGFFKHNKNFLVIRDNTWLKVSKDRLKESDLVGVSSSITKSLVFLESKEFMMISDVVKGMSADICIVDGNEYPDIYNERRCTFNSLNDGSLSLLCSSYDTDIVPLRMMSTWEHDIRDILNIIDLFKSLSAIINTFVELFYAHINPDQYSRMDVVPIVVLQSELLSIKLRNYSEYYVGEEIPSLEDYISLIYDLYREL